MKGKILERFNLPIIFKDRHSDLSKGSYKVIDNNQQRPTRRLIIKADKVGFLLQNHHYVCQGLFIKYFIISKYRINDQTFELKPDNYLN